MSGTPHDENREVLNGLIQLFSYYKDLGDKAMIQVSDADLFIQNSDQENSIAVIVKHLWGNMLSRWTNFLTEDGEKSWRRRDEEFENDIKSRAELHIKWEAGWDCLFNALNPLTDADLQKLVYIRNQGHTVQEALYRQLGHYAYHVGQIVLLCKGFAKNWQTLSIAKGGSQLYNQQKFEVEQERKHFTQEFINKDKQ